MQSSMIEDLGPGTDGDEAALLLEPLTCPSVVTNNDATSIISPCGVRSYKVLYRRVFAHPMATEDDSASIEVVIEKKAGSKTRTVVYSGPESSTRQILAMYTFTDIIGGTHYSTAYDSGSNTNRNDHISSEAVVWTSFAEDPDHLLLCVLVDSTTIYIYDVFPESKFIYCGGQGHGVTLPFEACSIFATPGQGLLVCRKPDMHDYEYHARNDRNDAANVDDSRTEEEDEDDGFFLQPPPRVSRADHAHTSGPEQQPLASLYTLAHPLSDVIPVMLSTATTSTTLTPSSSFVTNAFEEVVWVGKLLHDNTNSTASNKRTEVKQIVVVTHNASTQQHSVWLLSSVQVADPVYTSKSIFSSISPSAVSWEVTTDFSLLEDVSGTDDEVYNTMASTAVKESRNEALANALGVRTNNYHQTSNSTFIQSSTTPRPVTATSASASRRFHSTGSHSERKGALKSPSSYQQQSLNSTYQTSSDEQDKTLQSVVKTSSLSFTTHASIQLLYQDESRCQEHARVYIASDPSSLHRSVLCFFHEEYQSARMWSLSDARNHLEYLSSINDCQGMTCISGDNDIVYLLVKQHDVWRLYYATHKIATCTLPSILGRLESVHDQIANQLTCRCIADDGTLTELRCRFSLKLHYHFADQVLGTLEKGLRKRNLFLANLLSLHMRCDSIANSQLLQSDMTREEADWKAIEAVWMLIVEYATTGRLSSRATQVNTTKNTTNSAWTELLESSCSMFESSFITDASTANNAVYTPEPRTEQASSTTSVVGAFPANTMHYLARSNDKLHFADLFMALHCSYESTKLSGKQYTESYRLAKLLLNTCCVVKSFDPASASLFDAYIAYYKDDIGGAYDTNSAQINNLGATTDLRDVCSSVPAIPPSIYAWLSNKMSVTNTTSDDTIKQHSIECLSCTKLSAILDVYSILSTAAVTDDVDQSYCVKVVERLLQHNIVRPEQVLQEFSPGVALPILEAIDQCRYDPSVAMDRGWCADHWNLVGRQDLAANVELFASHRFTNIQLPEIRDHSMLLEQTSSDVEDLSGLIKVERRSAMLFAEDNRVHEAARLLDTAKQIYLSIARVIATTDHEFEVMKQHKLKKLFHRTVSCAVGRGMLTIGSVETAVAERMVIPEICMKGRLAPTNAIVTLDTSEFPDDHMMWPNFHNGVSHGLRLLGNDTHSDVNEISRTWIIYNRPPPRPQSSTPQTEDGDTEANEQYNNAAHTHGGFLLALGLIGHLTLLEMSDLYDYLTQGSVTTTVGVLLGMSANLRGSCDMAVSKMLCLHIPSLIPQHFSAIDVASTVQSAAIIGTGLLYLGSSHRMMTEFLINEIGRKPENDYNIQDRESYSLCCGFALGMVNLALKSSLSRSDADNNSDSDRAAGIADLKLEERLSRYIYGGNDDKERQRVQESNDRFSVPSTQVDNDNEKCSLTYEGNAVNIDMTSPGATVALGLMYIKSGNRSIASTIELPQTHYTLESVRPDFLALRLISRALIMWDEVEPTSAWLMQQVPSVIVDAIGDIKQLASRVHNGQSIPQKVFNYDRFAVRQIYAFTVSGACFGLALRYAGSWNSMAKDMIMERLKEFNKLREATDPVSLATKPDNSVLETCLSTLAVSVSLVMAGSGDVEVLRILRLLRWKIYGDVNYGSHMSYAMAIGLLFLGGGRMTVGQTPADIAMLYMSFYPRYPYQSQDNQFHLQALRHFYALTINNREVCAVDIDSGECVYADVDVKRSNGVTEKRRLPCTFPNSDFAVSTLTIASDDLYSSCMSINQVDPPNVIYVKRKVLDSRIPHNMGKQQQHHDGVPENLIVKNDKHDVALFVKLIAKYIYGHTSARHTSLLSSHLSRQSETVIAAVASLQCHSEVMIALYLHLLQTLQSVLSNRIESIGMVQDLKLVICYVTNRLKFVRNKAVPKILHEDILSCIVERIEMYASESPYVDVYCKILYKQV